MSILRHAFTLALALGFTSLAHANDKVFLPATPIPSPALNFGSAVAASGERLVIASTGEDIVRIYERGPADWHEDAQLTTGLPLPGASFGVALAAEGDVVVVGATSASNPMGLTTGAVFVFRKIAGTWTLEDKLYSTAPESLGRFGASVAIQGDEIVVGAPEETLGGQAYIFTRQQSGSWTGLQLPAPAGADAITHAAAGFGTAVAILGDDIAVGCPTWASFGYGHIMMYERVGGAWTYGDDFYPQGGVYGFGTSISMDYDATGAVRLASGGTKSKSGVWSHAAYTAQRPTPLADFAVVDTINTPTASTDNFGFAVSLCGDSLLLGASNDDDVATDAGAFYLYKYSSGAWTQSFKQTDAGGAISDHLGAAVALAPGVILVGQPDSDHAGPYQNGQGGAIAIHLGAESDFYATPWDISLAAGGTQTLRVKAGASYAGSLGLIVGAFSESAIPLPIDNALVYLGVDAYTLYALAGLAAPPYAGFLGVLDSEGKMQATITLPPASDPSLAGLPLYHAALVFDPVTGLADFATSNESLLLIP
jgi:hypothetical protein